MQNNNTGYQTFVFSSITYVHKAEDVLYRNQIKSRIIHVNAQLAKGCSYALEVNNIWQQTAKALFDRFNIEYWIL